MHTTIHRNESCCTCEWVMAHMWMSHGTHANASCYTYKWVMSHMWRRHVTQGDCHVVTRHHGNTYARHVIMHYCPQKSPIHSGSFPVYTSRHNQYVVVVCRVINITASYVIVRKRALYLVALWLYTRHEIMNTSWLHVVSYTSRHHILCRHMHTQIYVCVYMYLYICIYIYIYIRRGCMSCHTHHGIIPCVDICICKYVYV